MGIRNLSFESFEWDRGDMVGPPVQTEKMLGLLLQAAAHLVPAKVGANVCNAQTISY